MADRVGGPHQRGQAPPQPRCRYRGDDVMYRWVGLGVIADNLINIGALKAALSTR
jgi:hypothetical protein